MRKLFIFVYLASIAAINAQNLSKDVSNALEHLRRGYMQCAVQELKTAVSKNDLSAQYFLAECNNHGLAIPMNREEAFQLYRRAAERGLPDAMSRLADFYRNGIVVARNDARDKEWRERFKQRGGRFYLPDIMELYSEGLSHPENYAINPNIGPNTLPTKDMVQVPAVNQVIVIEKSKDSSVQTTMQKPAQTAVSDIDTDIPSSYDTNDTTFALIIANENYHEVAGVPNAINDGTVFAEYCRLTLGLPAENIHLVKDATLNNIRREVNLIRQIAEAYNGDARIIVYYAGHGLPDEKTASAYLLPVDGYGTDLSTCYSLADLYSVLGTMPAAQTVVMLDACFSGSLRGDGMLASARGVAIKARASALSGKMVVLSAAQGDETAYPYGQQSHGLFTYYLLKKLKETHGDITLGELAAYIRENVIKKSLVVNGKSQTPSAYSSPEVADVWSDWKLR